MGCCRELTTICYVIILSEFNVFPPLLILLIIILLWPRPHALFTLLFCNMHTTRWGSAGKKKKINFYFQTHNEKNDWPWRSRPSVDLPDPAGLCPRSSRVPAHLVLPTLFDAIIWTQPCKLRNAPACTSSGQGWRNPGPRVPQQSTLTLTAKAQTGTYFPPTPPPRPFFFFNLQSSWQTRKSH